MAVSTTIIPPSPLEARVLAVCKALLARDIYPSIESIRNELDYHRSHPIRVARQRLLDRGELRFTLMRGNHPFESAAARQAPQSLYGTTDDERRQIAANTQAIRLEWAKAGRLKTPLHVLNPGPYRLEDCRGRLLTFLFLKTTRRASRG